MSRWFRHYAGMMRDEKLVSAAVRSKQPIERVVWIWGAILESAAEINDNGKFALDTAEVAYFLRAEQAELDYIISILGELGRITGNCVVKWGDRQFSSDKSADRTRAYRDRQKEATVNVDQNVTEQRHDEPVTTGDGDVTACDGHSDAPETETETELETKKKEATGSAKRRTRYSLDFEDSFWNPYPRTPVMSKKEAWREWQKLNDGEKVRAISAVPRFCAFLKSKPDHPAVHACRFLSQQRFEGFQAGAENVMPGKIGFPVKHESDQWRAWSVAASPFQKSLMQRAEDTGQPFIAPSEWPPNHQGAAA